MPEYDLVCDACGGPLAPDDAVVSWSSTGGVERGFALTHTAHVPASASDRFEGRQAVWPNGYLRFVSDRLGRRIEDLDSLQAILAALAPFVMRPDNGAEMDAMRAASFGQRPGVKPGARPSAVAAAAQEPHEGGK
ncbi:MAG: hypothetical protein KGJ98_11150 [Chloroflexota bacterium]|nr:hypothetical protein [Chloroflexota bacterium]MDE3102780.1 hypothetical protein [Chloroflexota bacterium]